MDNDFRNLVIETLRRGEALPREWAQQLFPPEKREYELVYDGKEREEDILAGTMAVPLQQEIWPPDKRLTVEVLVGNQAARGFYEAVGFREYSVELEIPASRNVT